MRIAIFIDSRYRDTLGCLLVKQDLQKSRPDWDVLAISIDLWQQTMELFKPHIVVLNHAIGYRNKRIIEMADYSIILPTEGRPNTKEQEDWFVNEQDGIADLYLSWNEFIAKKFKKTKAVVTGCPRFDVYYTHRRLIDSKEKARAKYGLDQNRKTIGVFTSFPQAKFSFSNVKFNQNDWKDLGVDKISTRTDPLQFAKDEYAKRQEFFNAIAALSNEYPEYQFLVKPHPMEDVLEIQEWCDKNGFICVTQDPIYNTIAACDFVINRIGCITGLDANLYGIPFVSYGRPEAQGIADTEETLLTATTPYELFEAIDCVGFNALSEDWYIQECGLDKPATQRVTKAIVNEVDKIKTIDRPYEITNLIQLTGIMTQHSRQLIIPNPADPPVGKSAISGYIANIEATI